MLGPAELRELAEALGALRLEGSPVGRRHPYLTPQFALAKAMARAVAGEGTERSAAVENTDGA